MGEQNMIEQAMSGMVKGFFAEMAERDETHEKMRKEIENVSNARAAECKALTQLNEESKREILRLEQNRYYTTMRLERAMEKVREMIQWITRENPDKALEIIGKRGEVDADVQDLMVNEYCCIVGITEAGFWGVPEEEYVGDD